MFCILFRFYRILQQFEQRNYFSSFLNWITYIDRTWNGNWDFVICFSKQLLHSVYHYISNFQLFAYNFNFLCRLSFLFAPVFLEKFQKGFLAPLGRPRRLFTRSNLISSRLIWLEFKLIQYLMPVLVTCKFDDDPIKNTGAIVSTTFLPARKVTPKSMDGYGWNLKSSKSLCLGYL